jgi:hypothetical protein
MKTFLMFLLVALCACGQGPAPPTPSPTSANDADVIDHTVAMTPLGSAVPINTPSTADPRTLDQLKTAACRDANGAWVCRNVTQPHTFMVGGAPIIPTSWTVPAWYIDPANITTTASDNNDCVTSATACRTWQEINTHRWGCAGNPAICPRLRQNTAIEFLSSMTDNTDPVYFLPSIENGAVIQLFGPLGSNQQIATGTLSNVTAKNRATPQLLLAQSGATAVGQFVVNTTHPSRAWTYALSSGSIYKMTQPLTATVVPNSFSCGTEVNTWTNGDSVTAYQPVKINLASVAATFTDLNGGFTNYGVYIYNLTILDPNTFDAFRVAGAQMVESDSQKFVTLSTPEGYLGLFYCNDQVGAVRGGLNNQDVQFSGGSMGLLGQSNDLVNVNLIGDIILASSTYVGAGGSSAGSTFGSGGSPVYIETAKTLQVASNFDGTGSIWWGPGTISVVGTGRFVYTTNAVTNLLVGALTLNGLTTGHSLFTASNVDTPCGGITLNKTNLDAASSATCVSTGFGGLAFNPGGASFAVTNY